MLYTLNTKLLIEKLSMSKINIIHLYTEMRYNYPYNFNAVVFLLIARNIPVRVSFL